MRDKRTPKDVCGEAMAIPDSPEIEFGGKWIVRQKLKLEHKCVIRGLEPSNLEDW